MSRIAETDLIINPDGSIYHLNLTPQQITDTIIAVGDPDRVERVSQFFDKVEFRMNRREFVTHIGSYKGKRITVISTGIGTDNIELLLTELDALVNIDFTSRQVRDEKRKLSIIRIGTSGALQEDIPVGTHLVSACGIGFDNLMTFYQLSMEEDEQLISSDLQRYTGFPIAPYVVRASATLQESIGYDMVQGNTITAPGFYAPQGRQLRLLLKFPSLLKDLSRYHYERNNFRLTNFEMETAAYYAMSKLLGHEALSVNAIVANRQRKEFAKDPYKIVDSLIQSVLERI